MIDERKIKEAANRYIGHEPEADEGIDVAMERVSFQDGAQWAQEEFVNSLWHDASEEPQDHTDIVYIDNYGNVWSEYDYCADNYDDALYKGWQSFVNSCRIVTKWCYLSDILPEKGGGLCT